MEAYTASQRRAAFPAIQPRGHLHRQRNGCRIIFGLRMCPHHNIRFCRLHPMQRIFRRSSTLLMERANSMLCIDVSIYNIVWDHQRCRNSQDSAHKMPLKDPFWATHFFATAVQMQLSKRFKLFRACVCFWHLKRDCLRYFYDFIGVFKKGQFLT